jgi:hypothetical protein
LKNNDLRTRATAATLEHGLACAAHHRVGELASQEPNKPKVDAIAALLLAAAGIEGFIKEVMDIPEIRALSLKIAKWAATNDMWKPAV